MEILAAVLFGFILGRWTKTCSFTADGVEPMPSATSTVIKALNGNDTAKAFIDEVFKLAEAGDTEAMSFWHDLEAAFAFVQAQQEAAAASPEPELAPAAAAGG